MAKISISLNEQESQLSKKCSKCGKTKSINEFHKKLESADSLKSQCKKCISKYNKQYRKDNKEKMSARSKAYYQNNKNKVTEYYQNHKNHKNVYSRSYYQDNKDEILLQKKDYYQNNKDTIINQRNRYRQGHKKEVAATIKRYQQTEAGKVAIMKGRHKRRAIKAGVRCENFNPIEIFKRDGYKCQLCGRKTRPDFSQWHPLYPHLDHIVPLSKGGNHTKINTQCLCRQCNLIKHNTGEGNQFRLFG